MQAAGFSEVLRGVSHRILVEGSWGLSFDRPVAYLSEYLDALLPLLNERRVSVVGERVSAHSELDIDSPPCPVFIAALGARMLELAGRATSGNGTSEIMKEIIGRDAGF